MIYLNEFTTENVFLQSVCDPTCIWTLFCSSTFQKLAVRGSTGTPHFLFALQILPSQALFLRSAFIIQAAVAAHVSSATLVFSLPKTFSAFLRVDVPRWPLDSSTHFFLALHLNPVTALRLSVSLRRFFHLCATSPHTLELFKSVLLLNIFHSTLIFCLRSAQHLFTSLAKLTQLRKVELLLFLKIFTVTEPLQNLLSLFWRLFHALTFSPSLTTVKSTV